MPSGSYFYSTAHYMHLWKTLNDNALHRLFTPIFPLSLFCFYSLSLFIYSQSCLWKTYRHSYENLCNSASVVYIYEKFTIGQELEQGQVDGSFPAWILLQCNAITSRSKHFPTANGHQLAALIFASHVIQHSSIVDKGIQFPRRVKKRIYTQMVII